MGATFTLKPKAVRKADTEAAKQIAIGNRCSDPARFRAVHAAILSVVADGQPRELTDEFVMAMGGKAPAANLLHRMLKAEANRPYWSKVQALCMTNCIDNANGSVTGTPTWKETVGRLFICPVE